jgi:hypothetical protein
MGRLLFPSQPPCHHPNPPPPSDFRRLKTSVHPHFHAISQKVLVDRTYFQIIVPLNLQNMLSQHLLSQHLKEVLFVSCGRNKSIVHVKKEKIFFAAAMDNDVILITTDGKRYIYHSTFQSFLEKMKSIDLFRRVHRSHAIRFDCIAESFPDDCHVVLETDYKKILTTYFKGDTICETIKFGKDYMTAYRRLITGADNSQREFPFPEE